MEGNWEPFEVVEDNEGTTLRLHGTEEERKIVKEEDTPKILEAIKNGWHIFAPYVLIQGEVSITGIGLERNQEGRLVIKGNMYFSETSFAERADFHEASFAGRTDFGGASFAERASFKGASFAREANFGRASFERGADFGRKSVRRGRTGFGRSNFERGASFKGASFAGRASFKGANFQRGRVDFRGANFGFEADFYEANFEFGRVSFYGASFAGRADFRRVNFGFEADFHGASFAGRTDFDKASFEWSDPKFSQVEMKSPASFAGVRIRENTVWSGLRNEILCRVKKALPKKPITDVYSINTETVIDGSSNPYLKRYIDDEQWIKSWRDRGGWGKETAFLFWEATSHCGRSIWLWAAWSILIALLFALIFTPAPDWWPHWWWGFWRTHGLAFEQTAPSLQEQPVDFLSCLYFSIVNFTTLGFGDIVAVNRVARVLVTLEVVLGYVMLGGLISIFANKFARRS